MTSSCHPEPRRPAGAREALARTVAAQLCAAGAPEIARAAVAGIDPTGRTDLPDTVDLVARYADSWRYHAFVDTRISPAAVDAAVLWLSSLDAAGSRAAAARMLTPGDLGDAIAWWVLCHGGAAADLHSFADDAGVSLSGLLAQAVAGWRDGAVPSAVLDAVAQTDDPVLTVGVAEIARRYGVGADGATIRSRSALAPVAAALGLIDVDEVVAAVRAGATAHAAAAVAACAGDDDTLLAAFAALSERDAADVGAMPFAASLRRASRVEVWRAVLRWVGGSETLSWVIDDHRVGAVELELVSDVIIDTAGARGGLAWLLRALDYPAEADAGQRRWVVAYLRRRACAEGVRIVPDLLGGAFGAAALADGVDLLARALGPDTGAWRVLGGLVPSWTGSVLELAEAAVTLSMRGPGTSV